MMCFAAGYQHFADGAPFAEIALRHPSVKEVYFPWVGEPSGRPVLGFDIVNEPLTRELPKKCDLFSTCLPADGLYASGHQEEEGRISAEHEGEENASLKVKKDGDTDRMKVMKAKWALNAR